jgi:hypothetical protein
MVSTGVPHHTADPLVGMKALGACLRKDGAIGLALYAGYGRIGPKMLQSVFRELRLRQDDVSVEMVRETTSLVPADHEKFGRQLFQSLWRLDFLAMALNEFAHRRASGGGKPVRDRPTGEFHL